MQGSAEGLVIDQRTWITSLMDWFESCPLTSTPLWITQHVRTSERFALHGSGG